MHILIRTEEKYLFNSFIRKKNCKKMISDFFNRLEVIQVKFYEELCVHRNLIIL